MTRIEFGADVTAHFHPSGLVYLVAPVEDPIKATPRLTLAQGARMDAGDESLWDEIEPTGVQRCISKAIDYLRVLGYQVRSDGWSEPDEETGETQALILSR